MTGRPRLLFVSPQFLFPTDAGGKIRTTNILRGMKGGEFEITLVSPATQAQLTTFAAELAGVCDHFVSWPLHPRGRLFFVQRLLSLVSDLPASVSADRSRDGTRVIEGLLAQQPDVVVVDFVHATVLMPRKLAMPSIVFTHNVEAEIFKRHVNYAKNGVMRRVWQDQYRKMLAFEQASLLSFDTVIAVSERDDAFFRDEYGVRDGRVIPTAVDLDFFHYRGDDPRNAVKPQGGHIVFTGSMDWRANIDAIEYFMDDIWPLVSSVRPDAHVSVVGRNPPKALVAAAAQRGLPWKFTGFVDDVRPYVYDADAYVIPLRVGGGTRIKVYEAMAMGCPVLSTGIGVEGLPVEDGRHYLRADAPQAFADGLLHLLANPQEGRRLAKAAHEFVSNRFGAPQVARVFEGYCRETLDRRTSSVSSVAG
ncbi:glycosyltransferase [Telmatospirillum sp.]|uniref:glycosyltransferase n=1 Tax=Telmatospirillum sp. TaxID=2079197 RepID=UPI00284D1519|nr:glycosyltransferase [Telmatospirillum sp.]MDR3437876.1 glycosyltransferase [Telmatospirillum sp.]